MEILNNFKVWDKELNKWYTPIYEAYKNNLFELLITPEGKLLARDMDHISAYALKNSQTWDKRFIIVQPTGLIDKKKISIYIGDIVKEDFYISRLVDGISTDSSDFLSGTKWETEKQEEVFVVKSLIQIYKYVQDIVDISDDKDVKKYKKGKMLRIIGNIHENPELIEGDC